MFKREKIHLLGSILSLIVTTLTFIWIFLILKQVSRNTHIVMTIITIPIFTYTVFTGIQQYILKKNNKALFTIFIPFSGVSIFTSWTLYKESGINQEEVEEAILKWEEKNIEDYLKTYINKGEISREAIKEIENLKELHNKHFIEKAIMRTYIRSVILKEINSDKMTPLYNKEEILQLIPR